MLAGARKELNIIMGYILKFCSSGELQESNHLICRDLKETRLEAIAMNSGAAHHLVSVYDYDAVRDELGVFHACDRRTGAVCCSGEDKHAESVSLEIARMDRRANYRVIELPVTRALYSKLQKLTHANLDVDLTDIEVYHTLMCLLFCWDEPEVIAFVICSHFQSNPSSYQRLLAYDAERNRCGGSGAQACTLSQALLHLGTVIRSGISFHLASSEFFSETAFSGHHDNKKALSMRLLLHELQVGVFINFLFMSSAFLAANDRLLAEKFNYDEDVSRLEVQINFLEQSQCCDGEADSKAVLQQRLAGVADSKFLKLRNVVRIVLNLGTIDFMPQFNCLTGLTNKLSVRYFHPRERCYSAIPSTLPEVEVSFTSSISQGCTCYLSNNLTVLTISNAMISHNLSFEPNMRVLRLKNTRICDGQCIVLNTQLKLAEFVDVNGSISPCGNGCCGTVCLDQSLGGSFSYEVDEANSKVKLSITSAIADGVELEHNVTDIVLDCVTVNEEEVLTLNSGFTSLSIHGCTGRINFLGFMNLAELPFAQDVGFDYSVDEGEGSALVVIDGLELDCDTEMNLQITCTELVDVRTGTHCLFIECQNYPCRLSLQSCTGKFVLAGARSLERLSIVLNDQDNFILDFEEDLSMLRHLSLSYHSIHEKLIERILRLGVRLEELVIHCSDPDYAEHHSNLGADEAPLGEQEETLDGMEIGNDQHEVTQSPDNMGKRVSDDGQNVLFRHFMENTSVQRTLRSLEVTGFGVAVFGCETLSCFLNLSELHISFYSRDLNFILESLPVKISSLTAVCRTGCYGGHQSMNISARACMKLKGHPMLRVLHINGCSIGNIEVLLENLPMQLESLSLTLSRSKYGSNGKSLSKVCLVELILNFSDWCPSGLLPGEMDKHKELEELLIFFSNYVHLTCAKTVVCAYNGQGYDIDLNKFNFFNGCSQA
ncbi:hypothetical protein VCUG_01016 [Vavraia culicis subsp. floridensis]|uniref:Uncharacterized protein n=1 Tax=Vavraia culicis (isolate floridensis) TaxID=948595 RepID=L2GV38_VAVCU|nr:uncharacterized protein VCUG_01016 [Vavraia culicis subsp. floridensis]ELA47484.1 hypothetical protein VCUG_01016 [Vavraia culicis subsp. floridensis]